MPHIEALIFASDRPLTQMELTELLTQGLEVPVLMDRVASCLDAIVAKYEADLFPFSLRQSGGGYQFLTKPIFHQTVLQLNGDKYIRKLSAAALETLAIIAYRQPVTKAEIEYIRGVSVDYSIQKLLEKELILITGRKEDAIGKPLLYATSRHFMDYLGINSPDELPRLKEITNEAVVVPTDAAEAQPETRAATLIEQGGFIAEQA